MSALGCRSSKVIVELSWSDAIEFKANIVRSNVMKKFFIDFSFELMLNIFRFRSAYLVSAGFSITMVRLNRSMYKRSAMVT